MPLLLQAAGSDISSSLNEGSLAITEQLQNRKNTCQFKAIQQKVSYGNVVIAYETLRLRISAASGQKVLHVVDAYTTTTKFRSGDKIVIDFGGAHQGTYTIDTIDVSTPSDPIVNVTANLSATMATTVKIVRKTPLFAGVAIKSLETEIGYTGTFTYDVQCVDYGFLFDAELVNMEFLAQYPREIIGRVVYFYCDPDSSVDLDLFEAAWTEGGTGRAMTNSTDRIQGAYAQSTGVTGAGTATWTKTITTANLSAYVNLRFWWKLTSGNGIAQTALKVRIGADSSNYFEYSLANIGASFDGCWNLDSAVLLDPTSTTGSPALTSISWIQLVLTTTAAINAGGVLFDHMQALTGSFTLQNCQRGDMQFDDIRYAYQRPSDILNDLSKRLTGSDAAQTDSAFVWYIDYNRDVNLYPQDTTAAPFALNNTPGFQTMNYGSLTIDPDITKLINRIVVQGGDAPDANLYTQVIVADGQQKSWTLDYPPKTLSMFIDATGTGSSYVAVTIGEEGLVTEANFDYLFNFQNRIVRASAQTTQPVANALVKFTYYPYKPIRVRAEDAASIAMMKALTGGSGVFDGQPILDASIGSFEDARNRGIAELRQYSNAIITAKFITNFDGLHAGQVLSITDVNRSVAQNFLIQRIDYKQLMQDRFTITVTAASTMFGIVEFFQMLLKRALKVEESPSDFLQIILNQDEEITITDAFTYTHKNKTFTAALVDKRRILFTGDSGSAAASGRIFANSLYGLPSYVSDWYANFIGSESGTIQFASAPYNTGKELKITSTVGGSGKEARAQQVLFLPGYATTVYTIDAWIRVNAAMTNVSSGGAKLVIKEYGAQGPGGTVLATNVIVSGLTAKQDSVHYQATFTSNSSTAFLGIEFSIYQAIGVAALSDMLITPTKTETQTNPAIASFANTV